MIKLHLSNPAIFPEQLANDHIISWSNEGDLVYDPFMGSGTTAIACINTNRRFVGTEIDELYFNMAKKRVNEKLSENGEQYDICKMVRCL